MITGDFVNGLHLMVGLSTDTKPDTTSENTFFLEEDSGDVYYFSEGQWAEADSAVAGIVAALLNKGALPAVTSTDNGKVLGVENGVWTPVEGGGGADPEAIAQAVTDWLDENITEPTEPIVDASLSVEGAAADALATGKIFTDEAKHALLACFANVAWADDQGQSYYDALEDALYPEVHLTSITADYEQDRPILDTDSLDLVRLDLIVTANYSDGTTERLADDAYTLTGTLVAPSSTITVGYEGKTDTVLVIVTSILPEGYTRIEYVERPSGTGVGGGYNTTGFMLNGTDDAVIEMGVMLLGTPTSNAGGYFLACRQTSNNNTVGFGIYASQDMTSIGAFDGESALVPPHSGNSVLSQKFDLVVTKTTTSLTISDGINTDTVTRTPREMVQNLHVFGLVQYSAAQLSNPVIGRIYYLRIKENGAEKVNFIPCKRASDNAVGFWNSVAEEFKTDVAYVAGPEV